MSTLLYTGLKPTKLWSGLPREETHKYNEESLAASVLQTPVKTKGGAALAGLGTDLGNVLSLSEHHFVLCDTVVRAGLMERPSRLPSGASPWRCTSTMENLWLDSRQLSQWFQRT